MAQRLLTVTFLALCMSAAFCIEPMLARAASTPPTPVTVCIDPGHGGSPNPANPAQPYDSGAIGINGIEEKNLTLAVGLRLRTLLENDGVRVVMTRTTNTDPSIYQREETCIQGKASLFVSIHFNSYTTPVPEGALVLYPKASDIPFATTMEKSLVSGLAKWGIANDGIQFDGDWWTHAPMPQVTVESAYVSNPHDAALLTTTVFLNADAAAIRSGIETYDPSILRLKPAILAWRTSHHAVSSQTSTAALSSAHTSGSSSNPLPVLLALLIAGGAMYLLRRNFRKERILHRPTTPRKPRTGKPHRTNAQDRELLGTRHSAYLRSRTPDKSLVGRKR
ncbi:MAG: N-acetylmuramoyl-L-alanine amidase family protein [Candidatus Dormibacteria bacterium]